MPSSTIGNPKILEKPVPKSKKYQHIKSTLDTGHSLTVYLDKLALKAKLYKFRPNELFKRMKSMTLAKLFHEVSMYMDINDTLLHQRESQKAINGEEKHQTYLSNFSDSNVFSSVETIAAPVSTNSTCDQDFPFLLLDVREAYEYKISHIVTAVHYSSRLILTSNQFSSNVLQYRNKVDKLIIIYDEDETVASKVAQTFAERGIENVWMLSGGLKVFREKFKVLMSDCVDFNRLQTVIFETTPAPSTVSNLSRVSTTSGRRVFK